MGDFRVSVIIPVYRAEKYVTQAVESALQQSETGEVILIEDGSPDKSIAVCRKLEEQYKEVRLLRHTDGGNHGAAASRNLGIRSAVFPYIAFLDADDFYLPKRFSRTIEVFEANEQVDGVYEAIGTTFEDDASKALWSQLPFREITTVRKVIAPESLFVELMRGENGYFSFDGFTGRRHLFPEISYFNEQLPIDEDTDLMFKLSAKARLFPGSLDTPVAMRRIHGDNRITHHLADKRRAYKSVIQGWESLLTWQQHDLTTQQKKALLHRYIAHLRKIDYFPDFQWHDYLTSRIRMCRLAIQAPMLLSDPYFWRLLVPSRGLFKVARHG